MKKITWIQFFLIIAFAITSSMLSAQEMTIEAYNPSSTLKVKETFVTRAKFPFIDVHNHQMDMPNQDMNKLVASMDSLNMAVMVNLSGRGFRAGARSRFGYRMNGPEHLSKAVENVRRTFPSRFIVFTNLDFQNFDEPGWTDKAVAQLAKDVKNGANGLKVYKDLGLELWESDGRRVTVNDPRFDAIWRECGKLKIPVIIHTGEPKAFFDPVDSTNERWLELKKFPSRARPAEKYPSWETVMAEQHDIFRKNPNTIFIAAHFSWLANDLDALETLLDQCPNVYTEIAAIIYELGRQPRRAKQFFEKYQDRILFGKDIWNSTEYHTYFRLLETTDEYFPYYRKYHAFWRLYGLGLDDKILKKIYYKNALKIIPGINASLFPK